MEILITLYYIFFVLLITYFLKEVFLSPVTIFLLSQAMFFTGMIKYLQCDNTQDLMIIAIYIIGLTFFGMGAILGGRVYHYKITDIAFVQLPLKTFQRQRISLIIFISFLLFAFFCYKTRLTTITNMLNNLIRGQNADITSARIESYSVPGTAYIYMFRITLLPVVVISMLNKEYHYKKAIKITCMVFMIIFTLITGQRGGFAMVMFMWVLSYMIQLIYRNNKGIKNKVSKKNLGRIILIISVFLLVFFFLSKINGRISGSFIGELIQRFFDDNQKTAYVSFHYIFEQGITWGRNWYEELVNIIVPGDKYLPLSKLIFNIMYGSTRGTSPPCLWGSVFYNFSWTGVCLFAFFYGFFVQYMAYRFFSRTISSLRCTIYAYMFIDLGMLVAGGPFQLVNNGFVPLILLAYYLHADRYTNKVGKKQNKSLLMQELIGQL